MQAEGLTSQDDRIIDLIRPATPLYRESSLAAALDVLRRTGDDLVPLVEGSVLIGVVWAHDARSALLEGASMASPAATILDPSPPALHSSASREEAKRVLIAAGRPELVVIDPDGRYLGVVRAFDLFHLPERAARPPLVGGMATPLGVYLTNGSLPAGANGLALVLTGMAMTAMLLAGVAVTAVVSKWLAPTLGPWGKGAIEHLLPIALFFLQVRLSPIAATHGAEHMVVHAMERGEPLRPDIVRRMPRVHPRCGTNLAVGALLFTGLVQALWSTFYEAGALIALILTMAVWRPLGSFFQQYVTTRQPRERDIESGIAAAEELIAKYRASDRRAPTFLGRLAASGLPLIIIGSVIVMTIAPYLFDAIGLGQATLDLLGAEPRR